MNDFKIENFCQVQRNIFTDGKGPVFSLEIDFT